MLDAGRPREAAACAQELNRRFPQYVEGWYSSSQLALKLGNPAAALKTCEQALQLQPGHPAARLQRALCLLRLGREEEARPLVLALDSAPFTTAYQHATLGLLLSRIDQQDRALAHYQSAVRLEPGVSEHYYNLASVHRFLGNTAAAGTALDEALARNPQDAEAHRLRADLKRQTPQDNHVAELEQALARPGTGPREETTLCYALAKELEGLERWEASFGYLQRGAARRRAGMRYDVHSDIATMDAIRETYSADFLAAPATGQAGAAPIFVLGLPRTGTTLVERILGMHSQVQAAGELNDFALAMSRGVARLAGEGVRLDKARRVALSAELDFKALGEDYLASAGPRARGARHFVDKMPLNFLYVGLIHRALPHARIIHVVRDPLDTCYAIYKTLFADAYPFSYQLDELGAYYIAYRRLMAHWEAVLPGRMHTIHYEDLVSAQAQSSRQLVAHCGLEWEPACLDFHRSREASTTASASQVREPVHQRSVGRWQKFAAGLAPLVRQLEAAGIGPVGDK